MGKNVLLITGTPCVGKTVVANLLTKQLNAFYVNLTELAIRAHLIKGKDELRDSVIIDDTQMRKKILELVKKCDKEFIILDGHYAVHVAPKKLVKFVFVLRRDPVELRKFMENQNFCELKLKENLASEILDVCLWDAATMYDATKVCELDTTGKSVKAVVNEILSILDGGKKCHMGIVDWLGQLEHNALLEEFLQF